MQFDVLKHVDDALGIALWQGLRMVVMWAETPANDRAKLFHPVNDGVRARLTMAVESAPVLADALPVFADLQDSPGSAERQRLAGACGLVWEWADRCGLVEIATHYAEAAAYADPDAAKWAVIAGHMCRKMGGSEMLHRASAWLHHGFVLAVRGHDREQAVRALTARGALLKDMGRMKEARVAYAAAVRRAKRTGRRRQAAVAQHYMFALAAEHGKVDEAMRDASDALSLYPLHDERLPFLAHDFAYLLLRHGHYRLALRVLERAAEHMERPHEMGLLFGALARAAAGAGRPHRCMMAERAALNLIAVNAEYAASSLVNLSEAARLTGDWEKAERYAKEALGIASKRGDVQVRRLAAELLEAVENRVPSPPLDHPAADTPVATLARRIAARLRRWRRRARSVGPTA